MPALRTGITTGACAAAAAKAAATVLLGGQPPTQVEVSLPGGQSLSVPILWARLAGDESVWHPYGCPSESALRNSKDTRTGATGENRTGPAATASVRKDAGDDPDVTNGLEVVVTVSFAPGAETVFLGGQGVGTVTKPGLQIPPGQPAINPGPRRMIARAIADVTARPMCVEVAIPGGAEVAAKTYNPRLGIVGGLSVLGTTGIVRPYCKKALLDSLKCELDVAAACSVRALVLTPGNIGAKAVRRRFTLADEQVIEVGNEWGFVIDALAKNYAFEAVLIAGHPGKLAKLAAGDWDTHSSRSQSAMPFVLSLGEKVLGRPIAPATTTEGLFASLGEADRRRLADELARLVRLSLWNRINHNSQVAVLLADMAGNELGGDGDFSPWQ
jgi:cobalt-precorrin-5B (C1)-methyltransferase